MGNEISCKNIKCHHITVLKVGQIDLDWLIFWRQNLISLSFSWTASKM